MFPLPLLKADLFATLYCIARNTGAYESGTFTTQAKDTRHEVEGFFHNWKQ